MPIDSPRVHGNREEQGGFCSIHAETSATSVRPRHRMNMRTGAVGSDGCRSLFGVRRARRAAGRNYRRIGYRLARGRHPPRIERNPRDPDSARRGRTRATARADTRRGAHPPNRFPSRARHAAHATRWVWALCSRGATLPPARCRGRAFPNADGRMGCVELGQRVVDLLALPIRPGLLG